jgi:nucleotide-binding universal stress UspA family protein
MNTLHSAISAPAATPTPAKNQSSGIASAPSLKIARILVPIDFSPHALKALHYAQALAAKFKAEVRLLHVIEQLVYPGDWMVPILTTSDFARETRDKLDQRLAGLVSDPEPKTQRTIRVGRAWQEIVEVARERSVDWIVMGTHGYTGLRHVLLGSVAEKVVRHAPCPVLTVPPDERDFA